MAEEVKQVPQGKVLGVYNFDGSSQFDFAVKPENEEIVKEFNSETQVDGTTIKPDKEDIEVKGASTSTKVSKDTEDEEDVEEMNRLREEYYSGKQKTNESSKSPSKSHKEGENTEGKNEENQKPTQIQTLFKELGEKGILDLPEDFKGESDEEIYNLWEQNLESKATQILEGAFENNPNKDKAIVFFNYLRQGGDVDSFLEAYSNPLGQVDKNSETGQEAVVKAYLKRTTRLSDERISERIKRYKDTATLKEEADEAFEQLELMQKEDSEQLLKQQQEYNEAQVKERENTIKEIKDFVFQNESIMDYMSIKSTKDKQAFLDYLFKPSVKLGNQMVSKAYADDVNSDLKSYLAEKWLRFKGFDIGNIEKKVETKVKQNLVQRLNNIDEQNAKIKGTGRVLEEEKILSSDQMTEEEKKSLWGDILTKQKKPIFG